MSRFTRFLRVVVLPLAVLATIAATSASASAAPLNETPTSATAPVTSFLFHILSMSW
jgi:hypothetical protein